MTSFWRAGLAISCAAVALAGCVPYAPYPGGYGQPVYGSAGDGGYYAGEQAPFGGFYPPPAEYGGYEGARFGEEYGRQRGDGGQVFRQQQNYNQAVLAQQRQQNQTVQRQQQYNNAVIAQQNAYNQALLAQQRAAQGR